MPTSMSSKQLSFPVIEPPITRHARLRMEQRGISVAEVLEAISYGSRFSGQDASRWYVDSKAIARALSVGAEIERLRGLCVVRAANGLVITVFWMRGGH